LNEPLGPRTALKIGGPADLLLEVHTVSDLARAVRLARKHQVPVLILGNGSNLLVLDGGFRGLVIENRCDGSSLQALDSGLAILHAESGAALPGLANRLGRQGWSGLEWAIGVPGTIGACVLGNAGAHGSSISDSLLKVEVLDAEGARWLAKEELDLGYRTSRLKHSPGTVILAAELELRRDDPKACIARMSGFVEHRRQTQPTGASVGSMFKNPPGDFAGRLIERAGLKGMRVGRMQVSELHANFFVNQGGASAADVLELVELVRRQVKAGFGVDLELEIEVVGESR
jgi:UDP-N-acetylmuramate dehydrogenase